MNDFRRTFKDLDDSVLIDIEEYGSLMGISLPGMNMRRHQGELAEPAIQGGKLLRWRAGDVRVWLKELNQDSRPALSCTLQKRTGRPRKSLDAVMGGTAS